MTAKILTIDIETSPILAHVWGIWQQNVGINQILEPTRMICFGAKWHDKNPVIFKSEFHDGKQAMVESARDLLDEADVVVHFNGKTFDMPHMRREFVLAGLTPPSPVREVDLLSVVKRQFKFPSNKLAYVSAALGLSGKMSNSGHTLWTRCLAGDPKAWAEMKRYCVQDVRVEEELFDKLTPWIPSLNLTVFDDDDTPRCGRCLSTDLVKRGFKHTDLSVFQQFRCKDCGGWSRGGKRVTGIDVRSI